VQSQDSDADSLLNLYRQVIALRNASTALRGGDYQPIQRQGSSWGFMRTDSQETVLVVYNYGATTQQYVLARLEPNKSWDSVWPTPSSQVVSDAQGQMQLSLPAYSFRVLVLR
jgi:glycosidase